MPAHQNIRVVEVDNHSCLILIRRDFRLIVALEPCMVRFVEASPLSLELRRRQVFLVSPLLVVEDEEQRV